MLSDEQWSALQAQFAVLKACSRCRRAFTAEVVLRRVYNSKLGTALAVLCEACDTALPEGGAAELAFRGDIQRQALANVPAQGRA